jgi:cystathionine gamma-synthase
MRLRPATAFVHVGVRQDPATGAVSVPVHHASTFEHPGLGRSTGYDYARTKNPTREALETGLAQLEGGARGFAFASGMAALHCALQLFRPGDHVLVTEDLYGGTYRLLNQVLDLQVTYVDTSNLEAVKAAIRPDTRGLLVETLTNPMLKLADVNALAALAKAAGALLIVDNTFLTPYLLKPLELGADVVVHSASKYLSGHNDVLAGVAVARDAAIAERLAFYQNAIGGVLGPDDCWLLIRGIKTLALRMERHNANARRLADWLRQHPLVAQVFDPGIGGMLSFEVADASLVAPLLERVNLVLFAESLGGVESLITYPATQTHADIPADVRAQLGITDRLLRLSVGIEDPADLIADLAQALEGGEADGLRHEAAAHRV